MTKRSAEHDEFADIRTSMRAPCAKFPREYWLAIERERAYPTEFVAALTAAGYLAALIPEEFSGSGLTISAAAAILEEIHAAGCNGAACHAQMYTMGTILRHGSAEQKQSTATCRRCELKLATVVKMDTCLNDLRYASLPNIMKAKKKSIAETSAIHLSVKE